MTSKRNLITTIQWATWSIIYLLLLIYNVRDQDRIVTGFVSSTTNVLTWAAAIYCQTSFLLPRFWTNSKRTYTIMTVLCLALLVLAKMLLDYAVYFQWFKVQHFYDLSFAHFAFAFLVIFLCMVIGFLLHSSIRLLDLQQRQQELETRQILSELNSLRVQVQPHFMFNTLNNIYSLAVSQSDRTAPMISRLSDIMRYFVHDARAESVRFAVELSFIRGYIELEQMRMRYPVNVHLVDRVSDPDIQIPPMLFIPFIENYFKHGVNKTSKENAVEIQFFRDGKFLAVDMSNALNPVRVEPRSGAGIHNVRQRLELLYQDRFMLRIDDRDRRYHVALRIPAYD